jgi:hypothetical protein
VLFYLQKIPFQEFVAPVSHHSILLLEQHDEDEEFLSIELADSFEMVLTLTSNRISVYLSLNDYCPRLFGCIPF